MRCRHFPADAGKDLKGFFCMQDMVLHHSRKLRFRAPQGALPAGQTVMLALEAGGAYRDAKAVLRLWVNGNALYYTMERELRGDTCRFHVSVTMPQEAGPVWYYFVLSRSSMPEEYYGGESGEGSVYTHEPPGYQITVYDSAFMTPRWFRESILYQIFPDRFRRGGDAQEGMAYHRDMGRKLRLHDDWYDMPYHSPAEGQADYTPNDFFLGDLKGIRDGIPHLKSLGISCLYLNPVFESGSNHRYDTADYARIDPLLGTDEEFRALVAELRENGIRVMLDGVFSHTGADSRYFNKYGRYDTLGAYQSSASPYRSWYDFHPSGSGEYRTWWGFPELPEVNEMDENYLGFVMDGEQSLLRHWAGYGVANWRLDVADELPDAFIARMREHLKKMDPESVLLGEVWEDAATKEAYGVRRKYVLGQELDSVMNYPFQKAVLGFLLGGMDAYGLNNQLQTLREHYPKPFYYALMNLLSSHDTVRALTALGGAPDRNALGREQQAVFRLSQEMRDVAGRRLIAATALQMAMPGVPCIYYGDEAGVEGMADPFNRATYPWGREDEELLHAFRTLAAARSNSAAMRAGFCRMGAVSGDIFAVLRYTHGGQDAFFNPVENDKALCLINRAQLPIEVRISTDLLDEGEHGAFAVSLAGVWRDALSGLDVACEGGDLRAIVPAYGALLLEQKG